ncbi:MAG TPA: site-specific integrase [Terracidiphilus sp.]|nr:site-specific integrase [Terracidiphilus sp.]
MGTTYQRGYVTPRGKHWYGYYRKVVNDPATNEPKSVRVPVNLGPKSKMTKTEARQALEREITKQLGQPGSPTRIINDGSVTLGWFVNNRFIPLKEAVWKEETAKTKKLLIQLDIVEPLGDIPLVNFDKFSLQLHLNKLALTRSKDRVLQMRAYIRDIFAEAVDQDFLVKDPARKLKVPAQLRATDTTTLTWDQLRLALSKLSLRDRILLELDMTNALRPSELFAFRWKRFDHSAQTLTVAETVYKGKIRDWGKTKKSLTVIHIPRQLADDLQAWRLECKAKARQAFSQGKRKSAGLSPDDFMFENEDGGFLDTDNYRKRVLHKIARELNLPKLTFQVIRRTIATLAQKKGTVKDVQGVMRHSRTATTTDVYMQEIPESVQTTINSINSELRKSQARSRKLSKESASAGAVGNSRRRPSARVTQNDTKSWKGGGAPLPAYA